MTQQSEMKTTDATRHHPGALARFAEGLTFLLLFGFIGGVLMIIPPIGISVLLMAVLSPFYTIKVDSCDNLNGACPHCTRELQVKWLKAQKGGFNCKFCKRRVILQGLKGDEHFLGV